mgnify:CR=1 FL=1
MTVTSWRFPDDSGFDELLEAVKAGIADIAGKRFKSFDTSLALDRHLQSLAAEVWHGESSTPSVRILDEASEDCKLY